MVTGALFLVVKRPEREANHSPASSAEVKNTWICNSTHPYVFMALSTGYALMVWYLVKNGNNFTLFTFTFNRFILW